MVASNPKEAMMVRVSVHYPAAPGNKFDMEYYLNKHVALTKQRYGDAFLGFEIYEGASGHDGGPAPIAVTAHFYFQSPERLIEGAQKHNAELLADIANFTDIIPVFVIESRRAGSVGFTPEG
jgi:uncharacterized protein (TIGR02118 family)